MKYIFPIFIININFLFFIFIKEGHIVYLDFVVGNPSHEILPSTSIMLIIIWMIRIELEFHHITIFDDIIYVIY